MFYTRLGQKVIHILSSRTHLGQLYEVDMRLRPFGESGAISTTLETFKEYEEQKAWTWEHQALVRSRFVAGDPAVGARCMEVRDAVLRRARDEGKLKEDVLQMRQKMRDQLLPAAAKSGEKFDLKHSEGGVVDIEFLMQYSVLAWSSEHPQLTDWSDNVRILETLQSLGLFAEAEAAALKDAYLAYRTASHELALQQQPGQVDGGSFKPEREAVINSWQRVLKTG